MTAEDLFGLIVRLAGLMFILFGLADLFHAVAAAAGVPIPAPFGVNTVLVAAAGWVVVGVVLFGGADAITRLAYRKRRNPS
jgi:hypothetical protein